MDKYDPGSKAKIPLDKMTIDIPVEGVLLKGDLTIPDQPKGMVIFSHGSGSSRLSPRNQFVALTLQTKGFATLLFDLLTPVEDTKYENRFDIELLSTRLQSVTKWGGKQAALAKLNIGYFGASTGAASALRAAAELGPDKIKAVVSRGGRPDLAGEALPLVKSPTLLLVGKLDTEVLDLNESVLNKLQCTKRLQVIPGATHLFEEEGKLGEVTGYATQWFVKYLYRYPVEIEKDFLE